LSNIFTTPIFYIGNSGFSILSIFGLILLSLGVLLTSHVFSQILKRSLLRQLDRGVKETITSITNYTLSVIGMIIVLQSTGVNLNSLAVVAGVLGLGIGFGLQNLASNFISGLTILFEQPIKVGDYVELDKLLGTVEKISIRSTVIRTNDDVFVIVPNSKLIDSNIVNWSYQRPRCRLHLPISVAYGTDPVIVTELLVACARIEPNVLSFPTPKVWLKKFGDSGIEFEVLVWIDQPQESEQIKSSLNFLIEGELRSHGLEIPFPHREIRIHNWDNQMLSLVNPPKVSTDGEVTGTKIKNDVISEPKKVITRLPNRRALKDLLRKITYFEGCNDLELRSLIEQGYRKSVVAGEIICQEGDAGDSLYIILAGGAEVVSLRTGQFIYSFKEGDFFGEIAVLTGTPRTATVRALQDTTLFVVDHNHLQKLLKSHPNLAEQIAQKLAERQQILIDMGVMNSDDLTNSGETPFVWIKKHLQTLFGL
jgi:potassium-dependent mechanosensitive channel